MAEQESPLRFKVAPHIVQDLGLNLYTSLPRVLVEFVANAYDADSASVEVHIDRAAIKEARNRICGEWQHEKEKAEAKENKGEEVLKIQPLELRSLPESIKIIIEDFGHGMSRNDLQEKFLIAGRRRRDVEKSFRTPKGRLLMGRKGLGKLAGFGVAYKVEVISRKEGESHATRIVLDYNDIVKHRESEDVKIPSETLLDGGGIKVSGTKIILSNLVYGPMKSTLGSITHAIGDHFVLISEGDFKIKLAGDEVKPTPRIFVYAHPKPEVDVNDYVSHELLVEDGTKVKFRYRIRFTGPGQQLASSDRGVRVFAHRRLASAPDTLGLDTGIHGFRMTYYMDGVALADFLDEDNDVDYVATDRHSLRWDTALLAPLKDFLVQEMKEACNLYQKQRDTDAEKSVKEDDFTKGQIDNASLPGHRKKFMYRVASLLSTVCEDGTAGSEYRTHLPILIDGLAQGDILKSLAALATEEKPAFSRLLSEVSKLTAQEVGDFMRIVNGRLNGIEAFKKIVTNVDFKKPNNEKELHKLFEKSPWLIDPLFSQLVSSNETEEVMQVRLSKHLKIGKHVDKNYDSTISSEIEELKKNERPDLVFLLGSDSLNRIIIVELKAPNTPLHLEHLTQLKSYMRKTKEWLKEQEKNDTEVYGYLIGSKALPQSRVESVQALREEIREHMENAKWKAFDILELMKRAETVHKEFLETYKKSSENES